MMPCLNEAATMYSPHWLFLMPGLVLIGLGFLGYGIAIPGWTFHGFTLDERILRSASLAMQCSYQIGDFCCSHPLLREPTGAMCTTSLYHLSMPDVLTYIHMFPK